MHCATSWCVHCRRPWQPATPARQISNSICTNFLKKWWIRLARMTAMSMSRSCICSRWSKTQQSRGVRKSFRQRQPPKWWNRLATMTAMRMSTSCRTLTRHGLFDLMPAEGHLRLRGSWDRLADSYGCMWGSVTMQLQGLATQAVSVVGGSSVTTTTIDGWQCYHPSRAWSVLPTPAAVLQYTACM